MARPKSANLGYASQVVKQLTSLLHSDLYALLRSVDVVCCRCLTTGVGRTFLELYALHFFSSGFLAGPFGVPELLVLKLWKSMQRSPTKRGNRRSSLTRPHLL